MNFFNQKVNKDKSFSGVLQTCTPYCPFDAKNIPHPQFQSLSNSDACCLSKLQVNCRIKTRRKKKKRYNPSLSSRSTKRTAASSSSSSRLNPNIKRKRCDSTINTNSYYIHHTESNTQVSSSTIEESNSTERSLSSYRYYNKSSNAQQQQQSQINLTENIQDLKASINHLTQLVCHQQQSTSIFAKFRHLFSFFKKSSTDDSIDDECARILEHYRLTKSKLLNVYHLFDKNETLFLNWLQTIIPSYFLPLLLNNVKHFDSISTDNM